MSEINETFMFCKMNTSRLFAEYREISKNEIQLANDVKNDSGSKMN